MKSFVSHWIDLEHPGKAATRALAVALAFWLPLSVSAQLVPVKEKQAMGWGGDQVVPATNTHSTDPMTRTRLEELPAPLGESTSQSTSHRQQQESDLDFETIDPRESDNRVPAMTDASGNAVEIIRQRYPDGNVQVERYVTQDGDGNYVNHGAWKLFDRRGNVLAEGQFVMGKMAGTWERWHPAGSDGLFRFSPFRESAGPWLSVCQFSDGAMNGQWTVLDSRRRKVLEIPYARGKRHGTAVWYWPNGARMRQVQFVEGTLQGELIEWDQNKRVTRRVTYDKNRELVTRRAWYHRNQLRSEYEFLGPELQFEGEDDWWRAQPAAFQAIGQEIQHGRAREWHANGQLAMSGQYREGLQQGPFIWWYESGQKEKEGRFLEGQPQGPWRWWHPNGVVSIQGEYHSGEPVGEWIRRDESGKLLNRESFGPEEGIEEVEGIAGQSLDLELPSQPVGTTGNMRPDGN